VLKTFLNRAIGADAAEPKSETNRTQSNGNYAWLKALIELFPIGKKLRYYPEYKMDIVFETIIIAYCVNGHFLYSSTFIDRDADGFPTFFRTGDDDEGFHVSEVNLFQLVVPDTSDLEVKLDYESRASLGRGRQFVKGNSISLISSATGRGVTTVDTEVAKVVVQKDGPYSPMKLILLTPELDSFVVTDQRLKARAQISVPLMMSTLDGPLFGPCTIVDISDDAVRIRLPSNNNNFPKFPIGTEIILVVNLANSEHQFNIKGLVIRSFPEIRVVKLSALLKEGKYCPLSPFDSIELKSGLLNYEPI
jgi:hypothetical protein